MTQCCLQSSSSPKYYSPAKFLLEFSTPLSTAEHWRFILWREQSRFPVWMTKTQLVAELMADGRKLRLKGEGVLTVCAGSSLREA